MSLFKIRRPVLALLSLLVLLAGMPTPSWAFELVLGLSEPKSGTTALYTRPDAPPNRKGEAWPDQDKAFYVDWAFNNSLDSYWSLHGTYEKVPTKKTDPSQQFGPKIKAMMADATKITFLCAGVTFNTKARAPVLQKDGNPPDKQYTNFELATIAADKTLSDKTTWLAETKLAGNKTAKPFCQS